MTSLKSQLKFQLKNSFRLNSSFLFELEFTLEINKEMLVVSNNPLYI